MEGGGYVKMNLKMGVIMCTCFKWLRIRPRSGFLLHSIKSVSSMECEQIFG